MSFRLADLPRLVREKRKISVPDIFPVNANQVSGLSVYASLGIVYAPIAAVSAALLLDLFDGIVARSQRNMSRLGELTDWASDRYSEYIIFGWLAYTMTPWLLLAPIVNTAITLALVRGAPVAVLPLRHVLLLYLVAARFL